MIISALHCTIERNYTLPLQQLSSLASNHICHSQLLLDEAIEMANQCVYARAGLLMTSYLAQLVGRLPPDLSSLNAVRDNNNVVPTK